MSPVCKCIINFQIIRSGMTNELRHGNKVLYCLWNIGSGHHHGFWNLTFTFLFHQWRSKVPMTAVSSASAQWQPRVTSKTTFSNYLYPVLRAGELRWLIVAISSEQESLTMYLEDFLPNSRPQENRYVTFSYHRLGWCSNRNENQYFKLLASYFFCTPSSCAIQWLITEGECTKWSNTCAIFINSLHSYICDLYKVW